jgi:hypothetical protein
VIILRSKFCIYFNCYCKFFKILAVSSCLALKIAKNCNKKECRLILLLTLSSTFHTSISQVCVHALVPACKHMCVHVDRHEEKLAHRLENCGEFVRLLSWKLVLLHLSVASEVGFQMLIFLLQHLFVLGGFHRGPSVQFLR